MSFTKKSELIEIVARTQTALEVVSSRLDDALELMSSGRISLGITRAQKIAAELRALVMVKAQ